MASSEQVAARIAALEAELTKAETVRQRAAAQLAELEQGRIEMQLDQDLGAGDYREPLKANEKKQADLRGAQARAEASITDLRQRIEAVQEPLRAAAYAEVRRELDSLAPLARQHWRQYKALLQQLVNLAAEMNKTRGRIRMIEAESDRYHERRREPKPPRIAPPPLPALVQTGWLRQPSGPDLLAVWLRDKESTGPYQGLK